MTCVATRLPHTTSSLSLSSGIITCMMPSPAAASTCHIAQQTTHTHNTDAPISRHTHVHDSRMSIAVFSACVSHEKPNPNPQPPTPQPETPTPQPQPHPAPHPLPSLHPLPHIEHQRPLTSPPKRLSRPLQQRIARRVAAAAGKGNCKRMVPDNSYTYTDRGRRLHLVTHFCECNKRSRTRQSS